MILIENSVVKPGIGESPINWPHRVLMIDRDMDVASLIALPGAPSKSGKKRTHVGGPALFALTALEAALDRKELVVTIFDAPGHWSMTDEAYLKASPTTRETLRRQARLKVRDKSWRMIQPVVGDLTVREIARDPAMLRPKVLKRAIEEGVNPSTVYRTLNTYLASGGVRSSLIQNTHLRGAPGKEKLQTTKLGRKSRLEKAEGSAAKRYVLVDGDKHRLANGYMLHSKARTVEDAYLLTCGVFWSTIQPDGTPKLLPPNERPTLKQFKYWSNKLNTVEGRKKRMGSDAWRSKVTAGSTQDQVRAIGQLAMIDSTSTDVYLVSMRSRLKKLPPMHRTIVKEIRSTAIIGFYIGWEDPSSATALEAVLSSAESKVEICARFGIDITDEEWPYFLCKLFLADNGEMKAKFVTEAELEFRFGVEYAKSYSGQSKSDVENQHHTDHARLDHKLPGTTEGRQRERGEAHPAEEALWNYYEYMHEFLLMVIAYNNEEVPHLAPTAMLNEGVAPTRINIMKWMMAKNMRADVQYNVDQLRGYTLPTKAAVMTKTGIRLLMPDGRRFVPQIRFYAPELNDSPEFAKAAKFGTTVPISVKLRDNDLSHAWFTSPTGLRRVPNVSCDDDFIRQATLADLLQFTHTDDLRKDAQRPAKQQAKLDDLLRREGTTLSAKKEVQMEIDALGKKPSKAALKKDLRRNRDEELLALKIQADSTPSLTPDQAVSTPKAVSSQATSDAMDEFMRGLS